MRKANINRNTNETKISCSLKLDGTGIANISTGIGFFDHMLELFVHHSLIDMDIKAKGDINVDFHHTVEDTAYVIAQATNQALGEKKGINRYGFFYVPMDECLSRAVIDFSGRPEFIWKVNLGLEKIGEMDTELFAEFFKSFSNEVKCNLHIENLYGQNNHHIIESCFKAFAKSYRIAVEVDPRRNNQIPSSKGKL